MKKYSEIDFTGCETEEQIISKLKENEFYRVYYSVYDVSNFFEMSEQNLYYLIRKKKMKKFCRGIISISNLTEFILNDISLKSDVDDWGTKKEDYDFIKQLVISKYRDFAKQYSSVDDLVTEVYIRLRSVKTHVKKRCTVKSVVPYIIKHIIEDYYEKKRIQI